MYLAGSPSSTAKSLINSKSSWINGARVGFLSDLLFVTLTTYPPT